MPQDKRSRRVCSELSRAVANDTHAGASIGLPPPGAALTKLPEALAPWSGALRIPPSDSPYAARAERHGELSRVVALLLDVRSRARCGSTLLDAVATGDAGGWAAREALSNACGTPLANWDQERFRTQADRLALVDRALGLYGHVPTRRGGWSVGR